MTRGATASDPPAVLVTGGGGFVGQAVVRRLRDRGHLVRSFSRARYPELETLGAEQICGDLADPAAVDRAVAGCELVFHIAAKAGVWGAYEAYHRPNVLGTRHVIAACRRHGVGRLVFTSSPSVVFDGAPQEGVDESIPYPRRHRSPYSATKAQAEREILAANDATLQTVALRPHLVWGPGDNHIVPRILAQGRAGKLRIIGRGDNRVDTTYIDNAADAHLAAADALAHNPAAAGKAYFITNDEPRVVWDVINGILAAADLPPVTRRVPKNAAILAGAVLETLHRVARRPGEPRMTRFVAEELATPHWFDISAAKRDLGYHPQVTIADGLQHLRQHLHA